jgi:hypothetical protein
MKLLYSENSHITSCLLKRFLWTSTSKQDAFSAGKRNRAAEQIVTSASKQADLWVRGQPGLQSEFQDSQGCTEKPWLEKKQKQKQSKIKKQP